MTTPATESAILRKAARLMERDGFSPEYQVGRCGCFAQRLSTVGHQFGRIGATSAAYFRMLKIVGPWDELTLRRDGWTTPDAVAALQIAADLAECDERGVA